MGILVVHEQGGWAGKEGMQVVVGAEGWSTGDICGNTERVRRGEEMRNFFFPQLTKSDNIPNCTNTQGCVSGVFLGIPWRWSLYQATSHSAGPRSVSRPPTFLPSFLSFFLTVTLLLQIFLEHCDQSTNDIPETTGGGGVLD